MSLFETKAEEREALHNEIMVELNAIVKDKKADIADRIKAAKQFDSMNMTYLGYNTANSAIDTSGRAHRNLASEMRKLKGED